MSRQPNKTPQEYKAEIKRLSKELREAKHMVRCKVRREADLLASLSQAKEACVAFEEAIGPLKARRSELEEQCKQLEGRLASVSAMRDRCKNECEAKDATIFALQQEVADASSHPGPTREQIEAFERSRREDNAAHSVATRENVHLRKSLTRLRLKVQCVIADLVRGEAPVLPAIEELREIVGESGKSS